jgi:thiamine biosynthesis protein ThiS
MKTIKVNGLSRAVEDGWNLQQLRQDLGLAEKPVVMELNRQAISPHQFVETLIPDHAEIEVIVLAAGG